MGADSEDRPEYIPPSATGFDRDGDDPDDGLPTGIKVVCAFSVFSVLVGAFGMVLYLSAVFVYPVSINRDTYR